MSSSLEQWDVTKSPSLLHISQDLFKVRYHQSDNITCGPQTSLREQYHWFSFFFFFISLSSPEFHWTYVSFFFLSSGDTETNFLSKLFSFRALSWTVWCPHQLRWRFSSVRCLWVHSKHKPVHFHSSCWAHQISQDRLSLTGVLNVWVSVRGNAYALTVAYY